MSKIVARGQLLGQKPVVYFLALPGKWLLSHSTPSFRIKDPLKGFQRLVNSERAKEIAEQVLNRGRAFPNAVVLATKASDFGLDPESGEYKIELNSPLFIVDGQHRVFAQKFANQEAEYACIIHCGLNEVRMAELFLEINDNQKRVPSSLRWDLVRLVKPPDSEFELAAAEMIFKLSTEKGSPLFQSIDLTGEQKEIKLKQGSLAPEVRSIISRKGSVFRDKGFEAQFDCLMVFFSAVKSVDPDWGSGDSRFQQNRVMRVLTRLIPDIIKHSKKSAEDLRGKDYYDYLKRINLETLTKEELVAKQGTAGINAIYNEVHHQIFKK